MDDKDKRIAELEAQVKSLQHRLDEATRQLSAAQTHLRRQHWANHDSLPYPEEDDR